MDEVVGSSGTKGPLPVAAQRAVPRSGKQNVFANGSAFCVISPPEKYAGGDQAEPGQDEETKGGGAGALRVAVARRQPSPPAQTRRPFKVPSRLATTKSRCGSWRNRILQRRNRRFRLLRSGKRPTRNLQSMLQLVLLRDDIDCASRTSFEAPTTFQTPKAGMI